MELHTERELCHSAADDHEDVCVYHEVTALIGTSESIGNKRTVASQFSNPIKHIFTSRFLKGVLHLLSLN